MKAREFIINNIRSIISEVKTIVDKDYKGYTIRIVDMRPKEKGFRGGAFRINNKNVPIDTFKTELKSNIQEIEKELNDYIDSKKSLANNSLTKYKSGPITMFFNTFLSKEIFGPHAVLYADVEKVNGKPVLIFSNEDQGGMQKVYDRNVNKETGKGTGVFVVSGKKAIDAGLTLSRYDLGKEIEYGVDNVKAFALDWHSDVMPDEPMKLAGPGLTVSPRKKGSEMIEAKKPNLTMPKQRDPNWQTMQAKGTSGASGRHKDKKKAAKQGEFKHKGRIAEGIEELEAKRDELERVLKKARETTRAIKYEDTVNEITVQIQELAESIGVADELKYPLGDVYEAQRQLESAVYGLDEVFEEALRDINLKIDDMEDDVDDGYLEIDDEDQDYDRNN